jgi:hypothetical protein
MAERDEDLIDLDALAPIAGKRIKFKGKLYPILNIADIPADDLLLILRAEEEFRDKKGTEAKLKKGLQYIGILAPEMDQTVLGALSQRQVLQVLRGAMGAADIPPVGSDGPSDSATSSPPSPASTDGPSPTSVD